MLLSVDRNVYKNVCLGALYIFWMPTLNFLAYSWPFPWRMMEVLRIIFYNGGWSSLEFFEFKSFTSNWAAGIRHTYIEINLYCVDNNNEVCQIRCHEHWGDHRYHRCRVSFTMLSAVVVGKIAPKLTHLRIHWTINLSYQT